MGGTRCTDESLVSLRNADLEHTVVEALLQPSDEFFVHVIRGDDNKLIGVAPLLLRRIPVIGGLELRAIEFFGTDPSITEIRGVVCELADQPGVLEALRNHFRVAVPDRDLFRWQGIRAEAMQAFNCSAPALGSVEILPLLDRDGHPFHFRAVGAVEDHYGALESFFRLHAARAQVSEMNFKHADRFADGVNRDFIREFVGAMALQGRLRIFELDIAGEIVASRLAFPEGRELYLYYSGYHPTWRQYSVMTTLMAEIMRWAISHRLSAINLSTSSDLSKLRWRPKEITFKGGLECNSGWRGRVLARTYDAVAMGHRLAYRMSGYRPSNMAARRNPDPADLESTSDTCRNPGRAS